MYIISAVLEKNAARVALYDGEYKLILKKDGAAASLSALCLDVIAEGGIAAADVSYVGVATDSAEGSLNAFAAQLEESIGIKSYGASVMSARALGEAYIANDVSDLVLVKIDDTVDGGIVIDKKVYAGVEQLGGRLGHLTVQHGGYACSCGRAGCFEAYSSNAGLRRIAKDAGVVGADALTVKALFAMSTPEAEEAQKTYVNYLACAITNIINLFQPCALVLEGPFTEVGDALMEPFMAFVLREQYTRNSPDKCDIRFSNKEIDTALLGAALLGR